MEIVYLGHSSWVVDMGEIFLVFDYFNRSEEGDLSDGIINLSQIKDKNVIIFYSHTHHDHYSSKLHEESLEFDNVTTVVGGSTICEREKREIGGLIVYTANSTDSGVCFLIESGRATIFFAGDNADWGDGDPANDFYRDEIDYIASLNKKIDVAFIPVCTFSGMRPQALTDGAIYAIEKLNPSITFPMHANGREFLYKEFESDLRKTGSSNTIFCMQQIGQVVSRRDILL